MLNKFHNIPTTESETIQNINLFVQLFNVSAFKSDENKLKSIIRHHVKPLDMFFFMFFFVCLFGKVRLF